MRVDHGTHPVVRAAAVGITVVLSLSAASGCGLGAHATIREDIGGAQRNRGFASGTAYEAFLRAEVAATRGDPAAGARQLELAMMADPSDGFLPARRAEMLLAAGDRDAALESARFATTRFPTQAAGWLALGEVLSARGDRDGSQRAYERATAAAPDDPEVRAAVTRAAGGSPSEVARAMSGAPSARPGDHTIADRMALDPLREDGPTLRSVRRERAREAMARGAYREVEGLLGPLVSSDSTDLDDRVRLVEARARDGRLGDAARLVAGVPVLPVTPGVAPSEHARLWLAAGRADLAAEEAQRALANDASDGLARAVFAESLARLGRVREAAEAAMRVPPTSARSIDVTLALTDAFAVSARDQLASAVLLHAIAARPTDDAPGRDRLRIAFAERAMRVGPLTDAREILARIETTWGRQRRGALLLGIAPANEVAADLAVRSGSRFDDGRADAWRVLLCAQSSNDPSCSANARDAALARARENAPEAPETLRALAVTASDRRVGIEFLRAATIREPLSPWNRVIASRFEHRATAP